MSQAKLSIVEHFSELEDPRREHGTFHDLTDIVVIALAAVIAGADSWTQIEAFGIAKRKWLKGFLELEHGIPSHDTFQRVFSLLEPGAFEECFVAWMNACSDACGLQRIHIDGKTLRGSRHKDDNGELVPGLHLVSAWAGANHLTLGQVVTDQKSNEITAIPALLKVLDLAGCIVTIDAMGCQREIASQVIDEGGDYVLSVKDNQPKLFEDVQKVFKEARQTGFKGMRFETFTTKQEGRGRVETRTYTVIFDPPGLRTKKRWKGLKAVILVSRERIDGDKYSLENHYYISSVELEGPSWEEVIRGHWSIENNLHWVLDVIFKEDDNRTRDPNAAANFALLRKIALSLLKRGPGGKRSMTCRRKFAGWSDDALEELLGFLCPKPPEPEPTNLSEPLLPLPADLVPSPCGFCL